MVNATPGGPVPTTPLPSGERVPVLGQGTWRMGEDPGRRSEEVAALRLGLDLGMTLVDTAEMYAEGGAETVVGEAIAGRRDQVFLVSKVYPHNAGIRRMAEACDRSLARLGTDRIDLYLLHWREGTPLEEAVEAFSRLVEAGKIRAWGVSNFDTEDMRELEAAGGAGVAANQVLYNLSRRWPEWRLLDRCRARGIAVMAYSPIEQGGLSGARSLRAVAEQHGATPAQVALAWLLRQGDLIVIPKAARLEHVRENRAALDLVLTDEDLAELDAAFPPPSGPAPLEIL
jgi:diketogulonate reductase-like aldo/keto reductase